MTIDNNNLLKSILASFDRIEHINAEDIPNIDLYMDQVTTFMDKRLRKSTRDPNEDKILTKTMINNYAKNNLLPPPVKKKYSKEHILVLIFIYYFKGILSINDIDTLLKPLTEKYFDELLERIREIRLSERRFYQKVTDIYATSIDYDRNSKTTIEFFKKVQNKMHYAVTGNTAAEIIYNRANSNKEHMGLTNWSDAPNGKIIKSDVVIAKNYLSEEELYSLRRIVSAYLDLAESRAMRHIPMTMEDWSNRLDEFLKLTDREILQDAGKISHKIACDKAESEFEKYRIIQDQIYVSDFDKYINELEKLDVSDKGE